MKKIILESEIVSAEPIEEEPTSQDNSEQNSLYMSGKVGGLPPEPSTLGEKDVEKGIMAAEVLGGFTPASPLVQASGEGIRSLLKGESTETAAKKAALAGATDAALTYATGGIGKLIKKGAQYIVKLENSGIRKEILEETFNNPSLLQKAGKTIDRAGKAAYEGIRAVESVLGKLVGDAKAKLNNSEIKIDLDPIKQEMDKLKAQVGITGGKKDIPLETDINGLEAFDLLDKYTSEKFQKKLITKESKILDQYGAPASIEVIDHGNPQDLERAQQALNNIDASNSFQKIYEKLVNEKRLTKAESSALRIRNMFSDSINNGADILLEKAGLGESKQQYSSFRRLVDDPLVRLARKSPDNATNVIKGSLTPGKEQRYQVLRQIEEHLPAGNRFMDDVIRNHLEGYGINPLERKSVIDGLLGAGAKSLLAPSSSKDIVLESGKQLLKRSAVWTGSKVQDE